MPNPEVEPELVQENIVPFVLDDGQPVNVRPQRNRIPQRRLSFDIMQPDRDWVDVGGVCQDIELARACATEITLPIDAPGADATIFEPSPANLKGADLTASLVDRVTLDFADLTNTIFTDKSI